MLRRSRRAEDPRAAAITPDDFELRDDAPRRGARRRARSAPDPIAVTTLTTAPGAAPRSTRRPIRLARPDPLRRLRRGDHRSLAHRPRSSPPPTGTGTGPAGRQPLRVRRRRAAAAARAGCSPARIDAIAPPGPVLDVGAGDGTLIDALHAHGPRGDRARARLRPPRLPRRAARGGRSGEWAAIVFWHSLEHLPEPGRRGARRPRGCCAPGGVLVVAVPNAGSLQARVVRRPLAAPRPAPPPRPPHGARAARAGSSRRASRSSASRHVAAARS